MTEVNWENFMKKWSLQSSYSSKSLQLIKDKTGAIGNRRQQRNRWNPEAIMARMTIDGKLQVGELKFSY